MPGLLGLLGSLNLLHQVGVPIIEARINMLLEQLSDGLKKKGYQIVSPRGESETSGILSFVSSKDSHDHIVGKCRDAKIEIAKREGRLRVSPHFYNTDEQIRRLLSVL
ncbi:MAG: hypothetical protein QM811_19140 [Pirellulales bacterium]